MNDWAEKENSPFSPSIRRSMFNTDGHVILEPAIAGIAGLSFRDVKPTDFKSVVV